jgi:DNA mismatch endonuclease (patch repair protein)
MARIRGTNTTPERILRRGLWRIGVRYRLNQRTSHGRPDLVFSGAKVAIFIDGCFFHGCPEHYVRPRTNCEFWAKKLADNVARDRRQTLALEKLGWRVCRLWEHEILQDPALAVAITQKAILGAIWKPADCLRVVRVEAVTGTADLERRLLEELRNPGKSKVIKKRRSTRKWSSKVKVGGRRKSTGR